MKKQAGVLIFLITLSSLVNAQNSSQEEKNIQKFIQVWGLIKYKSGQSIAGKFDADQFFLANLAAISKGNETFCNEQLLYLLKENTKDLISSVQVEDKKTCLYQNLNNNWLKAYPKNLQSELAKLIGARNASGKHYYISVDGKNTGLVPNEPTYATYDFRNENMNLLALAKAWNAIEYLFPYKYVIGKDWQAVLLELIPVFRKIDSRTSYEKAVLMLENSINDTHAGGFLGQLKTMPQLFKLVYYPPFDYKVDQWKVVIRNFLADSLEQASALNKGDVIVAINGITIKKWLKQRSALLPASNDAVKQRHLSTDFRGTAFAFGDLPNKILTVKVRRGKVLLNLKLEMLERSNRSHISLINAYFKAKLNAEKAISGYEELGKEIAVIRAGYFSDPDLPKDDNALMEFSKRLKSKKAIVFDMRKYPASPGLFYYYLPTALGKPAFNFARYYSANLDKPGTFVLQQAIETYLSKDIRPLGDLYTGKIIILTNENTQSMGEWFAMMLHQVNQRAVVLGNQTAGADGDEKQLNLPGGYQFIFTGNGIFYPDGKATQRIGIVPDIQFKPTVAEIATDADVQLEKALTYLNQ